MVIIKAEFHHSATISKLLVTLTRKYVLPTCDASAEQRLIPSMSMLKVESYLKQGYDYYLAQDSHANIVGVIGIKDLSHIYHLFVADHFQRQGVAKKLWLHAKHESKQHGYHGPFTVNSALNAQAVYQKLGFRPTGDVRNREGIRDIPMVFVE